MPKQVIIPPGTATPIAPLFQGRSPTEWYMSPALCRSISKTMCSTPATQRRKPVTCWRLSKALSKRRGAVWRM